MQSKACDGEEGHRARALAPRRPRRLLIVDEDAEMRRMLRTFLHGEGFCVVEAGNAHEAIARASDGEYAAILLDAGTEGEGVQLVPPVRQLIAAAPVVLMTAVPGRPTSRRALALGAAGLLVKPFGLDDLLQLLTEVGAIPQPSAAEKAGHAPTPPSGGTEMSPDPIGEHRGRR